MDRDFVAEELRVAGRTERDQHGAQQWTFKKCPLADGIARIPDYVARLDEVGYRGLFTLHSEYWHRRKLEAAQRGGVPAADEGGFGVCEEVSVKSATLELAPFETAHVGGLQMRYLKRKRESQADQSSFVGGKPHLPEEQSIPTCELCGNSQSFMFQVAFPLNEIWGGRSIAVFFCVHCADEDFFSPEMLPDHLHECLIPDGFLTSYQRNFAFLVFPTAEAMIVRNYEEQVAFRAIEFVENRADAEFGKIGGSPEWELENEAPASYGAVAMEFLYN